MENRNSESGKRERGVALSSGAVRVSSCMTFKGDCWSSEMTLPQRCLDTVNNDALEFSNWTCRMIHW